MVHGDEPSLLLIYSWLCIHSFFLVSCSVMEEWAEIALQHGSDAWAMLPMLRDALTACERLHRLLLNLQSATSAAQQELRTSSSAHHATAPHYLKVKADVCDAVANMLAFKFVLRGADVDVCNGVDLLLAAHTANNSDMVGEAMIGAAVALLASLTEATSRLDDLPSDSTAMDSYVRYIWSRLFVCLDARIICVDHLVPPPHTDCSVRCAVRGRVMDAMFEL